MVTILPSGQVLRDYSREPAPPMTDRQRATALRATLDLLLSQIDYPMGACPMNARIESLVKADYLDGVRNILELTNERQLGANDPYLGDPGVQRGTAGIPSCVPSVPSGGGAAKMKTLVYSVLALCVIFILGMFLVGVFTPAPAHAGSCTSEKGSGVCRPTPQPRCPAGRRCA